MILHSEKKERFIKLQEEGNEQLSLSVEVMSQRDLSKKKEQRII